VRVCLRKKNPLRRQAPVGAAAAANKAFGIRGAFAIRGPFGIRALASEEAGSRSVGALFAAAAAPTGGRGGAAPSATPDRDDDFESVTVGEFHLGVAGLGHDLAVALDREALANEAACLEQGEHREFGSQRFGLAVEEDLDHGLRRAETRQKSYHAGRLTFPFTDANFRALSADLINSLRALNKYG
jgi:hypothetical protein